MRAAPALRLQSTRCSSLWTSDKPAVSGSSCGMAVPLLLRLPLMFYLTSTVDAAVYRTRPQPTAALLGQTVTLRCSFYNLRTDDVVNWFGPPEFQHISAARNVHSRYTRYAVVDSNADAGEFNLEIRDAQHEDDGIYRCSTFYAENAADARLTVVVPPVKRPEIIIKSDPPTVGQTLRVICRSAGGRPVPKLTWYNGTRLIRQPVHGWNRGRKTLDGQSVLMIPVLTKWDNGMNVTCKADQGFPDLVEPGVASVVLNVQYPPAVSAVKRVVSVKEGTFTNLSCSVDSNPQAAVMWRRLDGHLPTDGAERHRSFILPVVSREHTGRYQCRADNGIQPDAFATILLDVLFPPTIQTQFDKVDVLFGNTDYSLECKADGNPKPKIRWRRANTNLYFNNPLRFSKSDYQTEGNYECVAESVGFPTAARQAAINVIGRPDIRGDPETIRTSQGSSVTLLCEVNADPPLSSISWYWRNERGLQTTLRKNRVSGVSIRQRTTTMGTDSILVIDSVGTSNAGEYSCKAANMFGEDSRDFTIVVEGPPVFIIAMVTGVLAVSIILTVVAGICIARRRNCRCRKTNTQDMPISNGTKPLPPTHPKDTSMVELENFRGTMKPRPPTKGGKDLYAIGVNYPNPVLQTPTYASVDRRKCHCKDEETHRKQIHMETHRRPKTNRPKTKPDHVLSPYSGDSWRVVSTKRALPEYCDAKDASYAYDGPYNKCQHL
ncbi:kin of IRRE-like protein 3 isoform X1 [Branchiostoma lanceolatum]|uniref:kin of IRRE-like protein 3 isoform X1 n=1 Tax=Branchiostoma lanceolatum TaxID=7740 RepID=UPI0034531CE7